ncbi:hypothetical protein NLD30_04505 [SCandidatus Aminicenantes bacterium Aminicenantia_JdfR_composite]|nr:hypothetical protein [SCandidatus Aminicenantes bacterium Aminicenantia_JdfR_composite]
MIKLRDRLKKEKIKSRVLITFLDPFNSNDVKEIKGYIKIPFEIYLMPQFQFITR